jgi:hypothetical protein
MSATDTTTINNYYFGNSSLPAFTPNTTSTYTPPIALNFSGSNTLTPYNAPLNIPQVTPPAGGGVYDMEWLEGSGRTLDLTGADVNKDGLIKWGEFEKLALNNGLLAEGDAQGRWKLFQSYIKMSRGDQATGLSSAELQKWLGAKDGKASTADLKAVLDNINTPTSFIFGQNADADGTISASKMADLLKSRGLTVEQSRMASSSIAGADGKISLEEFKSAFGAIAVDQATLRDKAAQLAATLRFSLSGIDRDKSGDINFLEFASAARKSGMTENETYAAFDEYFPKNKLTKAEYEAKVAPAIADGSRVTAAEFKDLFKPTTPISTPATPTTPVSPPDSHNHSATPISTFSMPTTPVSITSAPQNTDNQTKPLNRFSSDTIDRNKNDNIGFWEFASVARQAGMNENQIFTAFDEHFPKGRLTKADYDAKMACALKDGKIDAAEFKNIFAAAPATSTLTPRMC